VLALSGVDSKDENNTPVGAKLIRPYFQNVVDPHYYHQQQL
jgi:hypothetical protein